MVYHVDVEATPKKVLECMKTKGVRNVSRDQVSSHLQVIVIVGNVCYILFWNEIMSWRHNFNSWFQVQLTISVLKKCVQQLLSIS